MGQNLALELLVSIIKVPGTPPHERYVGTVVNCINLGLAYKNSQF